MLKELVSWSGKIDQWVKVLVVKSDGQSSSSRTHMEEGERPLHSILLLVLMCHGTHTVK